MRVGDFKGKWFKHAALNMLILLVIFGSLIITICAANYGISISSAKKTAKAYVNDLAQLNPEDILNIANGDEISKYKTMLKPQFIVTVYNVRADGTLDLITENSWIKSNSPVIRPLSEYDGKETLGNLEFFVSQKAVLNKAGNVKMYIKVYFSTQNIASAHDALIINYIVFSIVFLFVVVGASLLLARLEVKPLIENSEKQKIFINDISHELRTPLTIIKGNIENLIAESVSSNEQVKEELYDALHEIEYMQDMTTGMLNIVRNSNNTKNKSQDAWLSDIVASVVEVYADLASMSGRSFVAMVDSCSLKLSKEKIKQLLTILLDNALKYTDEGDKIQLSLNVVKNKIKITVSDTGIGVPSEELPKLFERFYRASNVEEKEGTGLGLAIAKSIVDSFNGEITATTNSPKGLAINIEFDANKVNN